MLATLEGARPQTLDTIDDNYIHALVYGATGVGKTVFALGSQVMRTFLFDLDNGYISAAANPRTRKENVTRFRCADQDSFKQAYNYLLAHKSEYDLCVLDTATELQAHLVKAVKQKARVDVMSQREWGLVLDAMRDLTRSFLDLPMHVLFLAHEEASVDEHTRRTSYRPDFQGRYTKDYSKWFSLIARYSVQEKQEKNADGHSVVAATRGLTCHRAPFIEAKDRSDAMNKNGLEDPDIDKVWTKFLKSIGKELVGKKK